MRARQGPRWYPWTQSELQPTQVAKAPPGGAWQKQTVVVRSTEKSHSEKEVRPEHWAGQEAAVWKTRARVPSYQGWTDESTYHPLTYKGPTRDPRDLSEGSLAFLSMGELLEVSLPP